MFATVFSSVTLIWSNKIIFVEFQWPFVATLTFLHMLLTWAYAACTSEFPIDHCSYSNSIASLGAVAIKMELAATNPHAPPWEWSQRLFYGVGLAMTVIFMNLSLRLNSVGTYQLWKLLATPAVVFLEYLFRGRVFSMLTVMSLFFVTVSVGFAVVDDVIVSFSGAVASIIGIFFTTTTQVYVGWLQSKQSTDGDKNTKHTAMDILRQCLPISSAVIFLSIPLFDDCSLDSPNSLFTTPMTTSLILMIALSCSLAFCINLTSTLVIGVFSSLTYQALGHSKTLGLFAMEMLLYGSLPPLRICLGVIAGICGMIVYSYSESREAATPKVVNPPNDGQSKSTV